MKRFLLTALLLTAGCSTPPVSDLRGDWGGEHVSLTVTDGASSLTFDCAGGTITDPFVLTPSGTFDLAGTFTGGQGGPEPIDPPPAVAARYGGSVSSRTMQLRGVLADGTVVGPFVLEQSREPLLYRCL